MHFSFGANRGVAYENGKIFAAALDGRLFALDAKTGKELWVADTIPKGKMMITTGAPRVMNGKVIIGNGGADFGARGYVTAYDADDRQAAVALLHRSRQPRAEQGRCGDGSRRQDLGAGILEDTPAAAARCGTA